ncbi:MAG: VOC family protein [Caldilineaceae bacterium]
MNVTLIKHMTFAVRDAEKTLDAYKRLLGAPQDAFVKTFAKSRTKAAVFDLGGTEFQISESMDPDGRFAAWIDQRGHEGLHHICFAVEDIDAALAEARPTAPHSKNAPPARSPAATSTPKAGSPSFRTTSAASKSNSCRCIKRARAWSGPRGFSDLL